MTGQERAFSRKDKLYILVPLMILFPFFWTRAAIFSFCTELTGLPMWHSGKESACQCRRHKTCRFNSWAGKIPWRRKQQLNPVFLPGKSHGQRSLVDSSTYCRKELDTTEYSRAHTHTHTHTEPTKHASSPDPKQHLGCLAGAMQIVSGGHWRMFAGGSREASR